MARAAFREYYFRQKKIEAPDGIDQREFGYMQFGVQGMVRHLSFKNLGELVATLVKEVPSDVYCSNALYRFPTLPMQEKQWLGADLIFDIDGKDLGLPCVPSHSYLVCAACGRVSGPREGREEFACPACGAAKAAQHIVVPCQKCIAGSKKEAAQLLDFLVDDLGIDRQSIDLYFSGNNGFHFHVRDTAYRPLDSQARSDLVGYVAGVGLMAESVGVRKGAGSDLAYVKFPKSGLALGWRKRVADKLKIDSASTIRLTHLVKEKGGYAGFKAELDRMTREMGARVDPQVTTDVHRVFRMPWTLNSKSGLAKVKCDLDRIEDFDPFTEACVLGAGKVKVRLKTHVKFRLKGESFNLAKETAELPAYAAVYLICKGLADAAPAPAAT